MNNVTDTSIIELLSILSLVWSVRLSVRYSFGRSLIGNRFHLKKQCSHGIMQTLKAVQLHLKSESRLNVHFVKSIKYYKQERFVWENACSWDLKSLNLLGHFDEENRWFILLSFFFVRNGNRLPYFPNLLEFYLCIYFLGWGWKAVKC